MKCQKAAVKLLLAYAVIILTLQPLSADLHLKTKNTIEWIDGSRNITTSTEIWKTAGREYRTDGRRIFIIRNDLNKKWILDPVSKTYEERILGDRKPPDIQISFKRENLHNEGYDYQPEYDWIIESSGEYKTIHGINCEKIILDGDADYAAVKVMYWITDNINFDENKYENLKSLFMTRMLDELENRFEELKDKWVISEEVLLDPAISSQRKETFKVVFLEDADPPENIYEIPAGYSFADKENETGRLQ